MVKKKFLSNIKFWAGLLFAQFLLFYLFSKSSIAISIAECFFQNIKPIQELFFSKIPFSVGDLIYISLFLTLFFFIFNILKKKDKKTNINRLLILLNIFYFIYQLSWGLLYFRTPIIEQLPKKEVTLEEIKELTLHYIYLTNTTRKQLPEDQNGIYKIKNINSIKEKILTSRQLIPTQFNRSTHLSNISNLKPSLFGSIMNYTGILGYYNPFTSEAQYNQHLPNTYIPFTLAHESSHQLGFAREQEANFIGYIICENSNNIELQYSAYLYTSKSLLKYLLKKDPEFAGQAILFFSEKVKKDMANDKEFALQHSSSLEDFFHLSNDLFLKSNQQEGAVTYSYFIDLLVKYKRK